MTLHASGSDCAGGKHAKDRITVALCASMAGEKLKPLVIGKFENPRCFSKIDKQHLPVTYKFNKKKLDEFKNLWGLAKKCRQSNEASG